MPSPPVRLSELVASLALATDLGLGLPEEHVLRQTIIADRVAAAAGMTDHMRAATFYVSLLAWVGCIADSHELAHWFGDDTQLRADSYRLDRIGTPMLRFLLENVAAGEPPLRRLTMIGRFLATGVREAQALFLGHCQTAGIIAERLGVGAEVRAALPQAFERWDGRGVPGALQGGQIDLAMRVVQLANEAEPAHRVGGVTAAVTLLRDRRGGELDPTLVELCCAHAEAIFDGIDSVDTWTSVIDGCAVLDRELPEPELTSVLEVLADYADLKSPWFLGQSRAAAALATAAGHAAGLPTADLTMLSRAALICRIGRVGVSTGIWDKPGPLSAFERERVRTVPYLTERILCRQPRLAEIAMIAGMCYERMDGSGYPRGLAGSAIPMSGRLLAAADVYQAAGEDRPHRPALTWPERKALLQGEVAAGRLDADAVRAVLGAAGHHVGRRSTQVAGLTAREVEVLALLVRGWSNRQIAAHLHISRRTAGSHIEHIFAKTGVATRGAAAMFAMRHGLVGPEPPEERSGERPM
ncbi:LuxR C-terminal-related transcriptional regulator [Aldersonia sp. NBC_00410]|uniref:HD domain-containing phosphohydrolase n=1 Tax=Aldersonia sp. NBC_00410 TaxID=2975954 RepID=UPI00225AACD0|nr:HD domain-containing phosphohydrolase [Aldersonia sp. NBC_00410]MCX5043481.1 LuxR C-terminal-related transcriptional regulator [Aldersonia sp. NBC_00410]